MYFLQKTRVPSDTRSGNAIQPEKAGQSVNTLNQFRNMRTNSLIEENLPEQSSLE
jgi:hypothetical protein